MTAGARWPADARDLLLARVPGPSGYWDESPGLPVPTFDVRCPVCGATRSHDRLLLSRWVFFRRGDRGEPEGHHPFRCDVHFKCMVCAASWVHGVRVSGETYARWRGQGQGQVEWREGRAFLAGEGA